MKDSGFKIGKIEKSVKLFVLAILFFPPILKAEVIKIGGSTTTYAIFFPLVKKIEQETNLKIEMTQVSTGGGLAELLLGKTSLSMTSEPLDVALDAGRLAGANIPRDADGFQIFSVLTQEVSFVVHSSNQVRKLSWEQIGKIQTGKIKNWNEVGGKDLEIHVYAEKPGRGTRAMVIKKVMNGEDFGSSTRPQDTIEKAAERVSTDPGGFAAVGNNFVTKYDVKVIEAEKLRRPIGFISKGDPGPEQMKVINAFKNHFK